jgi:hypothetical protein
VTSREDAAQHIASLLSAQYDVIYHNLGFASPGEIEWAKSANAASLRAAARMPGDRYVGLPGREDDSDAINPLWYHGAINAE